ncbi:MAG: hypothetical protein Q9187_005286 [Circinaria calcarea]
MVQQHNTLKSFIRHELTDDQITGFWNGNHSVTAGDHYRIDIQNIQLNPETKSQHLSKRKRKEAGSQGGHFANSKPSFAILLVEVGAEPGAELMREVWEAVAFPHVAAPVPRGYMNNDESWVRGGSPHGHTLLEQGQSTNAQKEDAAKKQKVRRMTSREKVKSTRERQEAEIRTRRAEKEAVRQEVLATQGPAALEDYDREEQRKAEEAEGKAKQDAADEAIRIAAEKKAEHVKMVMSGEKSSYGAGRKFRDGEKRKETIKIPGLEQTG